MHPRNPRYIYGYLLCLGLALGCQPFYQNEPTPQTTNNEHLREPSYLAFGELLATGSKLAISERALAHHGQRIKLVGYMARLELPPEGSFYLTPIPVTCDEAGDGAAEIPLNSVLVTANHAIAKPVEHMDGLVEVTGRFEVGKTTDSIGRAAWFRVVLDSQAFSAPPATEKYVLQETN